MTPTRKCCWTFLRGTAGIGLRHRRRAQRGSWHRSVVPRAGRRPGSGALGRRRVALVPRRGGGQQPELPGDLDEDQALYDPMPRCSRPARPQRKSCASPRPVRAVRVSACDIPLSALPPGKHGLGDFVPPNVRWVVLHMIEETAGTPGHLDVARELLDGKGPAGWALTGEPVSILLLAVARIFRARAGRQRSHLGIIGPDRGVPVPIRKRSQAVRSLHPMHSATTPERTTYAPQSSDTSPGAANTALLRAL